MQPLMLAIIVSTSSSGVSRFQLIQVPTFVECYTARFEIGAFGDFQMNVSYRKLGLRKCVEHHQRVVINADRKAEYLRLRSMALARAGVRRNIQPTRQVTEGPIQRINTEIRHIQNLCRRILINIGKEIKLRRIQVIIGRCVNIVIVPRSKLIVDRVALLVEQRVSHARR